jgi:hypothetical protein
VSSSCRASASFLGAALSSAAPRNKRAAWPYPPGGVEAGRRPFAKMPSGPGFVCAPFPALFGAHSSGPSSWAIIEGCGPRRVVLYRLFPRRGPFRALPRSAALGARCVWLRAGTHLRWHTPSSPTPLFTNVVEEEFPEVRVSLTNRYTQRRTLSL